MQMKSLAEVAALFAKLGALSRPVPLPVTQRRVGPRPARSKYMPHQGPRECARRVRQTQTVRDKAFDQSEYGKAFMRTFGDSIAAARAEFGVRGTLVE